jgi:hypothetical protein
MVLVNIGPVPTQNSLCKPNELFEWSRYLDKADLAAGPNVTRRLFLFKDLDKEAANAVMAERQRKLEEWRAAAKANLLKAKQDQRKAEQSAKETSSKSVNHRYNTPEVCPCCLVRPCCHRH